MPKVFTKSCKIKVIEYGECAHPSFNWEELKADIQSYISKIIGQSSS